MTFNISHESPCFMGFSADKHLPKTDVGLLVDVDVPWFPSDVQPNAKAFWAHIDVDILKQASPMWTFPGNMRMQGDSGRILEQLLAELKAKATPKFKQAAAARVAALTAERNARIENTKKLAANKGKHDEINPHYLFAELNKVLKDDDIVFNEAIRNAGACLMQLTRPLPNTLVRAAGGGLGWSGGFALGAKLAEPDRMVVQVVGDGSFYFGSPCSVFSVAQQYGLPIFAIVVDNTGWSAVKESTLRVFPDGEAKAANQFQAGLLPDRRLRQDRRGVRRLWREGQRSGGGAGGARALRQGGARRPLGHPARAGDQAVTESGGKRTMFARSLSPLVIASLAFLSPAPARRPTPPARSRSSCPMAPADRPTSSRARLRSGWRSASASRSWCSTGRAAAAPSASAPPCAPIRTATRCC